MALSPKAQLDAHQLRAKKSFGQNFLTDVGVAQRIAQLAVPEGQPLVVVEIGAGLGALTRPLLEAQPRKLIAIERDRDLVPVLRCNFEAELAQGCLQVVEGDAKQVDWGDLVSGFEEGKVLVGNLPYQLTGTILRKCMHHSGLFSNSVFMVQLEVAQRAMAAAGSSEYGALSVFSQSQFEVTKEFVVRSGAFYPQPRVDSAVVSFRTRREVLVPLTPVFETVVKSAFQQRRKKLRSAWSGLLGLSNEQLASVAAQADVDLDQRGETLDVAAFARVADLLGR